jgi:hypothetical protein
MKLLLLLIVAFGMGNAFAQTPSEIQQWQSSHPDMLLMSETNYNHLSKEMQTKLKDKVVIYTENANLQLVTADKANSQDVLEVQLMEADADLIKTWIATNQNVKVVPKSIYESASTEIQQLYDDNHSLILKGETLTKEDVINYH